MDEQLLREAHKLAARFYTFEVVVDTTTEEEQIYVAANPELPGCMAQGKTEELALANLSEARIDYIASLLEDGLTVPSPNISASRTAGGAEPLIVEVTGVVSQPNPLEEGRDLRYRAAFQH